MSNIVSCSMNMKRFLEENQPFHVISRAVDEKKIFNDEIDCFRFIFQLYAANIGRPAHNFGRQDIIMAAQTILRGEELPSGFIIQEHQPLVYILDFALVINHNHLYLVSRQDNGIPFLMKKLNIGFAKYFNLKYKRRGTLFGSRYRAVPIKDQFQSDTVSRYISIVNPLDIFQPGWRENGLSHKEDAFNFLKNYQFSSFPDKIGERKSKILAPQEILDNYLTISFQKADNYKEFVDDFLKERSDGLGSFIFE